MTTYDETIKLLRLAIQALDCADEVSEENRAKLDDLRAGIEEILRAETDWELA